MTVDQTAQMATGLHFEVETTDRRIEVVPERIARLSAADPAKIDHPIEDRARTDRLTVAPAMMAPLGTGHPSVVRAPIGLTALGVTNPTETDRRIAVDATIARPEIGPLTADPVTTDRPTGALATTAHPGIALLIVDLAMMALPEIGLLSGAPVPTDRIGPAATAVTGLRGIVPRSEDHAMMDLPGIDRLIADLVMTNHPTVAHAMMDLPGIDRLIADPEMTDRPTGVRATMALREIDHLTVDPVTTDRPTADLAKAGHPETAATDLRATALRIEDRTGTGETDLPAIVRHTEDRNQAASMARKAAVSLRESRSQRATKRRPRLGFPRSLEKA